MKRTIMFCFASAIVGVVAGWFTNQKVNSCDQHLEVSYKELADCRLDMIIAQDALLHVVYSDNKDYWYDTLMETDEYCTLDSIRESDWEDFYLY